MIRPYAEVIGDPIAHSRSPAMHGFWLAELGVDADYRAHRVSPDELEAYLRDRRRDPAWRGCNVTLPLKTLVADHLSALSPDARAIGPVMPYCSTISRETTPTPFVRAFKIGLPTMKLSISGMRERTRETAAAARSSHPAGMSSRRPPTRLNM